MDDNDAFEAKLEAEPEAGGGLEANDDYNEVEIDAEPRRLDINPDTVLAAGEQSVVQVQTCEQCLTMLEAAFSSCLTVYKYDSLYLVFVDMIFSLLNRFSNKLSLNAIEILVNKLSPLVIAYMSASRNLWKLLP